MTGTSRREISGRKPYTLLRFQGHCTRARLEEEEQWHLTVSKVFTQSHWAGSQEYDWSTTGMEDRVEGKIRGGPLALLFSTRRSLG